MIGGMMMGVFDFFFRSSNRNQSADDNKNDTRDNTMNDVVFTEEFSTEIADQGFDVSNMPAYNSYIDNGIRVTEASYPVMTLTYNGLLAKNGAQEISAVVGYGNNLKWEDIETFTMQKVDDQTFEASIPIKRSGNINVVFKDSTDNWDNNSGMNYSFSNHFYQGSH
ncbi:MAG: carbohydrate-binding protein [Clostridia bacterium]|nr:carbohydrate-binding protein [Clostridia bacterium]